jgi:hypothetical protein
MKRFMFLSIGVLCLAIAVLIGFYVGSQRAEAQSSAVIGFTTYSLGASDYCIALLPNGDVYVRKILSDSTYRVFSTTPAYSLGNFWDGAVATDPATWSGVKGQFNK